MHLCFEKIDPTLLLADCLYAVVYLDSVRAVIAAVVVVEWSLDWRGD